MRRLPLFHTFWKNGAQRLVTCWLTKVFKVLVSGAATGLAFLGRWRRASSPR